MCNLDIISPWLLRWLIVVAVSFFALSSFATKGRAAEDKETEPSRTEIEFFEQEVEPILQNHCFKCHDGESSIKGGLRLSGRKTILKGGDTGPAVSLKKPDESLILDAINYRSLKMPPGGRLSQEKIDVITRWIKMGLPWTPGEETAEPLPSGPPPVNGETKRFWSYQPVHRPDVPVVQHNEWIRNPIDAFILKRLEDVNLEPSSPADKEVLIRRTYYDLTGLPPTPKQIESFLQESSRNPKSAYSDLIDRLLESPHYGERWARHWLDVVRYAESNSYERDETKPFVWRYRDYVIRAFNDDKPYNQFVLEQLAGDEIDEVTPDSMIATGYYRLGIWQDEPVDSEQELFEDLDDLVRTTGEVFLGMTIGCARCHDHKLDPIPQRDYYRLVAFFRNIRRYGVRGTDSVKDASIMTIATEQQRRGHEQTVQEYQTQLKQSQNQIAAIEKTVLDKLSNVEKDEWKNDNRRVDILKHHVPGDLKQQEFDRYVELRKQRDHLRENKPPALIEALVVKEHGRSAPPTHVLVRGNAHAQGDQVEPGFPTILSPPEPKFVKPKPGVDSTGRRLALAQWIASKDNPSTARVMVNRIWQHHFGRGIVRSSNDFGFQGRPPTHPQLLNWLAAEFLDGDWRIKRLHRLIMLSNAYQMSSLANDTALAKDPTNDLFWRFNMRRLSAEEIRDSILAVNGSLNRRKMFGPSIFTPIPSEVLAGQSRPGANWGKSSPEDCARRSIYIHVKRSLVVPMIASFDGPDTDTSCPVRFATTQPTQSLAMLNSDFIVKQSGKFAEFLRQSSGGDLVQQVSIGLRRTMQRMPSEQEIQRSVRLIGILKQKYNLSEHDALQQFCLAAINLNEFLYLD